MFYESTSSQATADSNVTIAAFDIAHLRARWPEWDALPRPAKVALLRDPGEWGDLEPVQASVVSNVTTEGLHEVIAQRLTRFPATQENIDPLSTILIGDDDTGDDAFETTDTELNNKIGSVQITDPVASGATYETNAFLSTNELNGENIREIGIATESGILCNHAPTSQVYEKDAQLAIIFNISITVSDA